MNTNENTYLNSLRDVLDNGLERPDRTGEGTISVFGQQNRYDLTAGFPMLTTKKMELRSVLSELLWFIEGSGDERRLAEIRFGRPRSELADKKTIWTANAKAAYWKDKAAYDGDLGRVYGVQWRNWRTPVTRVEHSGIFYDVGPSYEVKDVKVTDQIANLIDGLKRDPFGRRHILSAWNPGEIDQMALPPCHILSQFYVSQGKLSCQLYQRSADAALGVPYNIVSYALLTHMIAQVCGYKVGEFIHTTGDTHIYLNHVDGVKEQLTRTPKGSPHLYMNPSVKNIEEFTMDDFDIMGYDPLPAIKFEMAV